MSLSRRLGRSGKSCYLIGLPTRFGLRSRSATDTIELYKSRNTGCNNKLRNQAGGRFISLPPGSYNEDNYVGRNHVHFSALHNQRVATKVLTYIAEDMRNKSTPNDKVKAFRPDLWYLNPQDSP